MLFIPTLKGKVTVKLGLFRHSELWGEADEGCDEKAEREQRLEYLIGYLFLPCPMFVMCACQKTGWRHPFVMKRHVFLMFLSQSQGRPLMR